MSYARLNTLSKIPSLASKSIHIARPTQAIKANKTHLLQVSSGFHTTKFLKNQNGTGNQSQSEPPKVDPTQKTASEVQKSNLDQCLQRRENKRTATKPQTRTI
jgi:hypothetical protein